MYDRLVSRSLYVRASEILPVPCHGLLKASQMSQFSNELLLTAVETRGRPHCGGSLACPRFGMRSYPYLAMDTGIHVHYFVTRYQQD